MTATKIILNTLLTKTEFIKDRPKYDYVMPYLDLHQNEICSHIMMLAYQKIQQEPQKPWESYLEDINFCLDSAYQYIYYLNLQTSNIKHL